ncbi:hypothetical protein [Companilactobacillus farciminis]|uniref:hypothetical protein n=1 Tax=Companilactobacillus farciminis TaxID=1612 RepID=UPI001914F51F|nr:hypothetical protein [Companilactobacillus farciminis]
MSKTIEISEALDIINTYVKDNVQQDFHESHEEWLGSYLFKFKNAYIQFKLSLDDDEEREASIKISGSNSFKQIETSKFKDVSLDVFESTKEVESGRKLND